MLELDDVPAEPFEFGQMLELTAERACPAELSHPEFIDLLREVVLGLRPLPVESIAFKRSRNGKRKPGGCATPYCRKPRAIEDRSGLPRCADCYEAA